MRKIGMIVAGLMILITGCKKEFTEAGYDTVKDGNYRFKQYNATVKAYNARVNRVFSHNPSMLSLGIYRQPAFGISEADMVIQFNNSTAFNTLNFRNADSILYVELRIPFFSTKNEELSTASDPVYDLDSVFGDRPFKVRVYESNYYLFPYDPNSNLIHTRQYFSDFDFSSHRGNLLAEENSFYMSADYIIDTLRVNGSVDYVDDEVKSGVDNDTLPPHFVIRLDTAFFRQHIFDRAGQPVITNNELFKNHFRGIYIDVEPKNDDGSFALFRGGSPQLVLAYRYVFMNINGTPNDPSDDYPDHAYEKVILTAGNVINLFSNDFYPSVDQKIDNTDMANGEDKLYVKGQAASMGVVEMFTPTELYELRNNDWLINQANIRFYTDENEMAGIDSTEYPQQLYLYKKESNSKLSDLSLQLDDGTPLDQDRVLAVFDGRLSKDEGTGKYYYEFNITRHIKEVLRKDSANVKLALRTSENLTNFLTNPNPYKDPDATIPFGVVLKGNRAATDQVELRIYYTEPEDGN